MASINNPAGRLYLIFGRLRELDADLPIIDAWAQVFNEDRETVRPLLLGDVAGLVRQIEAAVAVPGREQIAPPVSRYRAPWLEAISPISVTFEQALSNVRPADDSYETLGVVAAALEAVASEGTVPPDAERGELLDKLRSLIDEVRNDDELPDHVKHLMVQRLTDIEQALVHIDIGGPDAIRQATEALMGATVAASVTSEKTRKAGVTKKLFAVAASIYVVFTAGPQVQKSLEAWPEIVKEIAAETAKPAHSDDGVVDAEVVEALEHLEAQEAQEADGGDP